MYEEAIVYRNLNLITEINVSDYKKSRFYFVKQIEGQPYRFYWFCYNYFNLWFKSKKTIIGAFQDEYLLDEFENKHKRLKYIIDNGTAAIYEKPKMEVIIGKDIIYERYFENYPEAVLYARKFIKENNLNLVSLKTNF